VLAVPATADEVNNAFRSTAQGDLAGIIRYCTDPVVSRDIIGDPASCVFDSELTQASGTLVKVFGWYDNEWGYSCRLADLTALVGSRRRIRGHEARIREPLRRRPRALPCRRGPGGDDGSTA
jgi:glyceraldehyde 3-phosphate dehydrogenase